jgi:anti-sigma factor RsiW
MDETREELLSAYLDDELSDDERARVETWLAADSAYRQLYDELRAALSRMRSLARHKLDHDLGPAVLRRAERNVLAGDVRVPAKKYEPLGAWWSTRSWRMLTWPAVAAAAAIAIAMLNIGEQPDRQVARDAPREAAAPQQSLAAGAAHAEGLPHDSAHDEAIAAPAPASPPPDVSAKAAGQAPDERRMMRAARAPAVTDLFASQVASQSIVCEVAQDFIDSRAFEKLLASDENKLAWYRTDAKAQAGEADKEEELADKKRSAPDRFTVNVTPDELAALIGRLKEDRQRVFKIEKQEAAGQSQKAKPAAESAPADKLETPPREPMVFEFRAVAAPAQPAKP